MKYLPINYGNKLKLIKCHLVNKDVFQADTAQIEVKWKILGRIPLDSKICYYFTDGQTKTITFIDTEKPLKGKNIFYSQMCIGESFDDVIDIKIPSNIKPGKYEISAFVFSSGNFESKGGIASNVWPGQKVIKTFEVKLQTDLKKKFSIYKNSERSAFFDAMIDFWEKTPSFKTNPNIDMWADFAFTTNVRGSKAIKILKKYINIENKSFLDIGCAYCGFLVAAKLEGARFVEGVDIDKQLIDLGVCNLKDYSVDAKVTTGDILDGKYVFERNNLYDAITCNDVIEHVLDPELAIKNIAFMLRERGVSLFEIPNMNHPSFVIKDGHFSIFAITLLEREDALEYSRDSYKVDYSPVGFYKELDFYKSCFNKCGLEFAIDESTTVGVEADKIVQDVNFIKENFNSLIERVDSKHKALVVRRVKKYLDDFNLNQQRMSSQKFLLYYGPAFWTVVGRK